MLLILQHMLQNVMSTRRPWHLLSSGNSAKPLGPWAAEHFNRILENDFAMSNIQLTPLKRFLLLCLTLASVAAFGQAAFSAEPLPKQVPVPANNAMSQAKINLGRQLFFDPRLSKDGTVSCNSCHNVMLGGEDGRAGSVGIKGQVGGRSAPTVWNSAFLSVQFWDGRAATLEEQAIGPLTNPIEMGMESHDAVIARVQLIPGYVKQFKATFGKAGGLNIGNLAKAIAAYERTLVTRNSPVDLYLGGKKAALNASAQRGLILVESVGCMACHSGPNYAGPALPVGTGFYQKFPVFPNAEIEAKYKFTEDTGRFQVTKAEADRHTYRVPTWRNIALTAPYFHNGAVNSLEEAVRVMAKLQLNKDLADKEVTDIAAFLLALNGERPAQSIPRLPDGPMGASLVQ